MKFESKYNLDDTVYTIWSNQKQNIVKCPTCEGKGSYTLKDSIERSCPECYGRKTKTIFEKESWKIQKTLTIGQIRIQETEEEKEIKYMCYETGIGSGTIYSEETLFATKEKAQKECDTINKGI